MYAVLTKLPCNGLRETTFEKGNLFYGLREATLVNEIYQKHELFPIDHIILKALYNKYKDQKQASYLSYPAKV